MVTIVYSTMATHLFFPVIANALLSESEWKCLRRRKNSEPLGQDNLCEGDGEGIVHDLNERSFPTTVISGLIP